MTGRHRENTSQERVVGRYYNRYYPLDEGWKSEEYFHTLDSVCDDEVGDWEEDNPLDLTHEIAIRGQLIGEYSDILGLNKKMILWPWDHRPDPIAPSTVYDELSENEKNSYAMQVAANTNPSTPHVSVPTFIGELKDLPALLHGYGQDLLSILARYYLEWRWCIKPMVRDLRSMIQFQEAVNNRVRWLRRLRTHKPLKRRCSLSYDHVHQSSSRICLNSEGCWFWGWRKTTFTEKVWGTAQWILDPEQELPYADEELLTLARRMAFGITGYEALNTTWELLPWSWFIDWFSALGDTISAANNTVPVIATRVNLMRETSSRSHYEIDGPSSPPGFSLGNTPVERYIRKQRYPIGQLQPALAFTLPFVEWRQWSILLALAAGYSENGRMPKIPGAAH
jgi:hypothetical protein